ncbi:MAG: radical SAM protein [Pelagibacterales bacterium]|nr:radical SAM protein [Pelagibacterales bacterium]
MSDNIIGYNPLKLTETTEKIVIDGNKRKYANLARPLRFYGGTTSATEVGCNLRCKFCFSENPVRKPHSTGKFYTPKQVFDALSKTARKNGHKLISASASEGTLGKEHLLELLALVDESDLIYILETNGMTLGNDPEYCKELSQFKNLHVRVSIKGCNKDEFHQFAGADPQYYELPFKALENLMAAEVSCNACVMISFSSKDEIKRVKAKLSKIRPGLLKSLELESITLFPKVRARLKREGLTPNTIRHAGKIINYKESA